MLHCELEHCAVWRRQCLDGEDSGVEDVGPFLLLSTEQPSQNLRIVNVNAVDHGVVIGTQAGRVLDSGQAEEAIVYPICWDFLCDGVLCKNC